MLTTRFAGDVQCDWYNYMFVEWLNGNMRRMGENSKCDRQVVSTRMSKTQRRCRGWVWQQPTPRERVRNNLKLLQQSSWLTLGWYPLSIIIMSRAKQTRSSVRQLLSTGIFPVMNSTRWRTRTALLGSTSLNIIPGLQVDFGAALLGSTSLNIIPGLQVDFGAALLGSTSLPGLQVDFGGIAGASSGRRLHAGLGGRGGGLSASCIASTATFTSRSGRRLFGNFRSDTSWFCVRDFKISLWFLCLN